MRPIDYDAFRTPDWTRPLEPEAFYELMPEHATAKGMFFELVLDELERQGLRAHLRRDVPPYRGFKDYPYRDLLELEVEAAQLLHPRVSLREGLRRLGRLSFPMFTSSMIGRVVFGVIGADPGRVLRLAAKGYGIAANTGHAEPLDVGEDQGVLRLETIYNFPAAYHVGLVEGALEMYGRSPEIKVVEHSLVSVDILAIWG